MRLGVDGLLPASRSAPMSRSAATRRRGTPLLAVSSRIENHGLPDEEAAQILITGSPAEIAERFVAYSNAGVQRLVLAHGPLKLTKRTGW